MAESTSAAAAGGSQTSPSAPIFDVFLSHDSEDKPAVERLANRLREAGLKPWLDRWYLTGGDFFQENLARALRASRSCAIFVGRRPIENWVREELAVAQNRAATNPVFRLIPVLLPGVPEPVEPTAVLPPFLSNRLWVDLRAGIDDPAGFQQLLHAISGIAPGPPGDVGLQDQREPYPGLQTFKEEDADFFFGRDADVQRLLEKLKATRFLAVLGPSGSGKSSLVRAGLVPALRRGDLPGANAWRIHVLTPGPRPLEELAVILAQLQGTADSEAVLALEEKLQQNNQTLHLEIRVASDSREARTVLVVDQFEEVFTRSTDETARRQFLANLLYAATVPDGQCVVVPTLRADFYARCATYPELAAELAAQQYLVSPMSPENMRQVIEEPAHRVGLAFEAGLVDRILDDAAAQPGALPLLQHTLRELWLRRRGRTITFADYDATGRVAGALATQADNIYNGLSPEQQATARRVLLRLTQPGEGTEDTRRQASISELVSDADNGPTVEAVVHALANARLLTTSRDERTGEQTVDVAHEALIRGWPRLQAWIEEDRAGLRVMRRLSEAAQYWHANRRDEGALYRGGRLTEAREWHSQSEPALNDRERAFFDASVALQRRGIRRRNLAVAGLVFAALLTTAAAIFALAQRGVAVEQQQIATSRDLAANAIAQLSVDPELSVLLALSAVRSAPTAQAEEALRQSLLQSAVRTTLRGHDDTVYSAAFSADGLRVVTASHDKTARVWDAQTGRELRQLVGHTVYVNSAAFSPDGQRVITASGDHTARVWNVETGKEMFQLTGHDGPVNTVAYSPDQRRILTASDDNTVRLWDAATGKELLQLIGHADRVNSAAFSTDGQRVVTASSDMTARVWDSETGVELQKLTGHSGAVNSAAFSPDGRWVVTASDDLSARLWDAQRGVELRQLRGHTNWIFSARFSPDGQRVVTASYDQTVRLWDAQGSGEQRQLRGHTGAVNSVAFSPDGLRVVTASDDGTARVWDAQAGGEQHQLRGHGERVNSGAFSADGKWVVTASDDQTARVWDAQSGQEQRTLGGHTDGVHSAAFSPDGLRVVTASLDKTVRVWDAQTGTELRAFRGQSDWIFDAAFSPDGQWVVAASRDGTARIWDVERSREVQALRGHEGIVTSAAFSPDGQRVITASEDRTARVWDVRAGQALLQLRGHTSPVYSAAFSPDGQRVVTASQDGTARIWDAQSGKEQLQLHGHTGTVYTAVFSPDGKRVITSGFDKTARVWDAQSGRELRQLRGHTAAVYSVAISPDSQRLVTGGEDHTARIWDYGCELSCSLERLVSLAQTRVTRDLTPQEREQYFSQTPGR